MRRKYRAPVPYYAKRVAREAAQKAAVQSAADSQAPPGEAEPKRRRPLLWRLEEVPEWALVRLPDFAEAVAGLTPAMLKRWRKKNVDRDDENATGTRCRVDIRVFQHGEMTPKVGPFAHSLLAVMCMVFASADHGEPDPDKGMTVSFPLWDLAELLGYDVALRYPETVDEKGETVMDERDYRRLKAFFDEFRKNVKEAMAALWAVEVPVRFVLEQTDTDGRRHIAKIRGRSRIISAKGEIDRDLVVLQISPHMAYCLQQAPLRQIPSAALRLDARAKTAYSIAWKMAARYTDARNHASDAGAPDRLTVKTLLLHSALPMDNLEEVLGRKQRDKWRSRFKEPLERALGMLCGNWETKRDADAKPFEEPGGEKSALLTEQERRLEAKLRKDVRILESWEYVKPGGEVIEDRDAYFQTFDDWQKALVRFTFRNPPKIAPKRRRGRPRKAKPAELGEPAKTGSQASSGK